MKNITTNAQQPLEERKFAIELTGRELLHLWALSYTKETGDKFPTLSGERMNGIIQRAFPDINFKEEHDRRHGDYRS